MCNVSAFAIILSAYLGLDVLPQNGGICCADGMPLRWKIAEICKPITSEYPGADCLIMTWKSQLQLMNDTQFLDTCTVLVRHKSGDVKWSLVVIARYSLEGRNEFSPWRVHIYEAPPNPRDRFRAAPGPADAIKDFDRVPNSKEYMSFMKLHTGGIEQTFYGYRLVGFGHCIGCWKLIGERP